MRAKEASLSQALSSARAEAAELELELTKAKQALEAAAAAAAASSPSFAPTAPAPAAAPLQQQSQQEAKGELVVMSAQAVEAAELAQYQLAMRVRDGRVVCCLGRSITVCATAWLIACKAVNNACLHMTSPQQLA